MTRTFMRAKIHRATVTDANVDYIGSVTLDPLLMQAAGLLPLEQVDVLNCANGNRLSTYCIEGRKGSGEVCINGAAALLCSPGDVVLIVGYAQLAPAEVAGHEAVTVFVTAKNRVKKVTKAKAALSGKPSPKR